MNIRYILKCQVLEAACTRDLGDLADRELQIFRVGRWLDPSESHDYTPYIPIPSMGLAYLPTLGWFLWFSCRQIHHTWMIWVLVGGFNMFQPLSKNMSQNGFSRLWPCIPVTNRPSNFTFSLLLQTFRARSYAFLSHYSIVQNAQPSLQMESQHKWATKKKKKTPTFQLYWFVNRDPGSL